MANGEPEIGRVTRSKAEAQATYDKISRWYDLLEGMWEKKASFMSFTLELFDTPEIPQVLGECIRVLRSGGRICIVSLSKAGGASWMQNFYEWGHEKFPNLLNCRPIYVEKALRDAGFQILNATRTSLWGLPIENVLASKPG
jgi:DNA modification methylase